MSYIEGTVPCCGCDPLKSGVMDRYEKSRVLLQEYFYTYQGNTAVNHAIPQYQAISSPTLVSASSGQVTILDEVGEDSLVKRF